MSFDLEELLEEVVGRVVRRELLSARNSTSPSMSSDERVSRTQAAAAAGVSAATITKWAGEGRIKVYGAGRKQLYSLLEVRAVSPDKSEVDPDARAEELLRGAR